jgi:hypothetical protein
MSVTAEMLLRRLRDQHDISGVIQQPAEPEFSGHFALGGILAPRSIFLTHPEPFRWKNARFIRKNCSLPISGSQNVKGNKNANV